jgi:hypothetical protein
VAESAAASSVLTAQNAAGSTTFTLSLAVLIPAPSARSYPSPETNLIGTAISALSPTVTGLVTKYRRAGAAGGSFARCRHRSNHWYADHSDCDG